MVLGLDMLVVGFEGAVEVAEACEMAECVQVAVVLVVDGGAVAFVGAHYGGAEGELCPAKEGAFVPSLPSEGGVSADVAVYHADAAAAGGEGREYGGGVSVMVAPIDVLVAAPI